MLYFALLAALISTANSDRFLSISHSSNSCVALFHGFVREPCWHESAAVLSCADLYIYNCVICDPAAALSS